ncbi:MAG TPA: cytochrome ubiquinol oxidase subunit I [Candidatus Saccharimonadales bacterium]|jgi:cytochrome d ubiquinol oxidase subunit I|nr:cytochrome ubiquinol oxidase subunit I [Candidatus Saccharimonadales bacterium]
MQDPSVAGRVLMGDSLGFHIIFALFGVGIPLLLLIGEFVAVKTNNERLMTSVKSWSRIAAILVVAGVISGTIIGFQFALLWPNFTKFLSPIIGEMLSLEGYAFLLEAIFLSFYIFSWDRIKGFKHWWLGVPVFIGGTGSAIFITTVNAWMNVPRGFDLKDGKVINIDRWAAIFNPAAFHEVWHSIFAYYLATALTFAGVYAWILFKKRGSATDRKYYNYLVQRLAILSVVLVIIVMALGDYSAKTLATTEPRKLAGIELRTNTTAQAPLYIGGSLNQKTGKVEGGIEVPYALSILAGNSPSTVVQGLNDFQKDQWPPLVIHTIFDIKIGLSMLLLIIPVGILALYWWAWRKKTEIIRWSLPLLAISGPIAIAVIELGWVMTELGRQPFAIVGYMTTKQAFTTSHSALQIGFIFPVLYGALFIVTGIALAIYARKYRSADITKKVKTL